MMRKDAKLNPGVFHKDVKRVPIRQGYGEGLLVAGEKDERVVALCADLTGSTKTDIFAKEFPKRFVEMGIAEQSMASVASGMAAMGKVPFLASYAMFSPGRNWEQIRTTICYNNVNVKIAGAHAGISVGPDGGTHQAIEDIALMRIIPRMTVIVPCDAIEAKKATIAAAKMNGPVYIRLAREKTPIITSEKTPFSIGKSHVFFGPKRGVKKRLGIIASGAVLHNALVVARELEEDDIGTSVLNISTIKPLDTEAVLSFAEEHDVLVTVEEHQLYGGMGSTVAEFLSSVLPKPIGFVGIRDLFGQSGTPEDLIEHYGMDVRTIKETAIRVLKKFS